MSASPNALSPNPPQLELRPSTKLDPLPIPIIQQVPLPQAPPKRNFNLKMGDTIYFKSYLSENFKGVVSGDGIASNKLECVQIASKSQRQEEVKPSVNSEKSLKSKAANLIFQKCLLQLVNGKKYFYSNQLKDYESRRHEIKENLFGQVEDKAKEEVEENQRIFKHLYGSNIVYGQEVQLIHSYSNCVLTLNHMVLAKQNCCRELSLEEHPNQNSNFRVMSLNNAKNPGEPVLYGDQIILRSTLLPQWALGIQKPMHNFNSADGLEVNASEVHASLKVSSYIDNKTDEELKVNQIRGKYLQSGDIITIKNRALSGLLAIKRQKTLTDCLQDRPVFFKDYETNVYREMTQSYFDVHDLKQPLIIEKMYQLYVDTSDESGNNLNTLWQIQHNDSLTYSRACYDSVFLIKHITTGCFLYLLMDEYTNTMKLCLTYDGLNPFCRFQLKSKKKGNDPIALSEACKIQSFQDQSLIIHCPDERNVKLQKKSQKKNQEQSIFLLKSASDEMATTANRISSLQTYLMQFYIFLQSWGLESHHNQLYYDYFRAFNTQKTLYDEIQQLFQSLENLKLYLCNEHKPQSNEDLILKQQAAMDNDIINLLLGITQLCHFMIYGSPKEHNRNQAIPDKSPQKIAKIKLDPLQSSNADKNTNCITEIYSILQLCVQSNPKSSDYILTLKIHRFNVLDFLLQQLRHHRQDVSTLLKESVRYTDMNDERSQANISKWVDQLQMITEDNIEDLTLFVEILSLMMIDPFESPNQACQDRCRRLIFKKSRKHSNSLNPFQKSLIVCRIKTEKSDIHGDIFYPFIEINYAANSGGIQSFALQNQQFCQLYSKFVEKLVKTEMRFHNIRPAINEVALDFFTVATLKKYKLVRQEDMKAVIPSFQKYENFILNVLNLYASLCKGRNQKSIDCLKLNCGINQQFLEVCLNHFKGQTNELRTEKSILSLYVNLILDIDPLIMITKFENKTYLKEDIESFDLQSYSGSLFYETNASQSLKESKEYSEFQKLCTIKKGEQNEANSLQEYQQLKAFTVGIIKKANNSQIKYLRYYIDLFTSIDYPDHLKIQEFEEENHDILNKKVKRQQHSYNYDLIANYQLEYFLSMLTLIRNSIDLGYNDLDTNRRIFQILPNILIAIILQQTSKQPIYKFTNTISFSTNMQGLQLKLEDTELLEQLYQPVVNVNMEEDARNIQSHPIIRTWILEFLLWTTSLCSDQLLCMKVYLEALAILKVFYSLKINLQILGYLGQQYNNASCGQEIQRSHGFSRLRSQSSNLLEDRSSRQGDNDGAFKVIDAFQEKEGVNVVTLLFACLYNSDGRTKLNEELISILIQSFQLPMISCREIKEVELIDDATELQYFAIVNGNSLNVSWISPREAMIESRRVLKYLIVDDIINPKDPSKVCAESFEIMNTYLNQIIEQFKSVIKDKADYLQAFQNIIRNAGIHLVFKRYLVNPRQIRSNEKVVQFYKNMMLFFEYFAQGNITNIQELSQMIKELLLIAQLRQQQASDIYYIPLKIKRLVITIIAGTEINQQQLIKYIFELIHKLGTRLNRTVNLFAAIKLEGDYEEEEEQEENQSPLTPRTQVLCQDAIDMASVIQYLKILKAMNKTFDKPAKTVPANKHLILTTMLKNPFLHFIMEPVNFFESTLLPDQVPRAAETNKLLTYYQMLLHANAISLLTECCQYYRLGIQEMQRVLLYEQLKTILLSPVGFYIVKRAYLQCLFELYINKVFEGEQVNEVIENDEVRDILSRIIIPELDQKQICNYLEGLAKLSSEDRQLRKESIDLRQQIVRQKKEYFEKRQSMGQDNNDGTQFLILRDCSEYWKYIRKNGIIHFLVYSYDEMKDRVDLERAEDSNLSDEFAIIKQNVQKIKELFNVLERDFRMKKEDLNLDEYRDLITSIEEIIPQRKITKFGQNFRIGFQGPNTALMFDKYDTLKEDQGGEKKLQEQDNVQRIEDAFQRNVKIYLIRHFVTIQEFCQHIDSKEKAGNDKVYKLFEEVMNDHKSYIVQQDITKIREVEVKKIQQQDQLNNSVIKDEWTMFQQALGQLFAKKSGQQQQIDKNLQAYRNEEQALNNIKKMFIKSIKVSVRESMGVIDTRLIKDIRSDDDILLSNDTQIQLLLLGIQSQQQILGLEQIDKFLLKCMDIFFGNEIYLIKLCRILLSSKQPNEDEIDTLSEQSGQHEEIRQKLKDFQEYQLKIAEGDIDVLAFDLLSKCGDQMEIQIEAITLLINLLEFGNEQVQVRILQIFKGNIKTRNTFIQFLREFFMRDFNVVLQEMKESADETLFEQLCLKIFKLLQVLCENVNVEFQKFLVIQNDDDSYTSNMNIVGEVSNLLANFLEDTSVEFNKKNRIIRQGIESLIEFSTGYADNKKELCKNTRLFLLLNQIIGSDDMRTQAKQYFTEVGNTDQQSKEEEEIREAKVNSYYTLQSFIKLLLAMTQGNVDKDSLKFILEMIDIQSLLITSRDIYNYRIKPKLLNIELDNICDEQTGPHINCHNSYCITGLRTDEDNLLIQTGFNIFIICIKLSEHFPSDVQLEIFKFDEDQEDEDEQEDDQHQGGLHKQLSARKSQIQPMNSKYEEVPGFDDFKMEDLKNLVQDVDKDPRLNLKRHESFFKFYRRYTGRIEICNKENNIEKVYFQKPFLCKFMTPNVKLHLIYEAKRESDEDRMLFLIDNSDFYSAQMVHNQGINNHFFLNLGASYWRFLKDISFALCLTIVIMLIFMHDTVINSKIGSNQQVPDDTEVTGGEIFVSYLNNIITIIQLVLNLIIVVFCSIERYPISIMYRKEETNAKKIQILKKEAGFNISAITMLYYTIIGYFEKKFEYKEVKNSMMKKFILIMLLDGHNFYNIILFALTCYAFFNPYIYAVLLLDIVKRSEDLQNIIKSITSNGRNLAIFSFLGFIALLIYAIIAFVNFRTDFDDGSGVYGYDFLLAVTSTVNFGLRNGGGLGESLQSYPNPDDMAFYYWGRYFFDFTFFIIFNILFIQIIFGIILDTFGELRDERQALIKEIEGKCFICSLSRNDIDTKGSKGWFHHIYLEHNVYNMMFYIVYLKKKNLNDCNALEKFVKECIETKQTGFFPFNRALQLDEQ